MRDVCARCRMVNILCEILSESIEIFCIIETWMHVDDVLADEGLSSSGLLHFFQSW